jgi:hypothetical protein
MKAIYRLPIKCLISSLLALAVVLAWPLSIFLAEQPAGFNALSLIPPPSSLPRVYADPLLNSFIPSVYKNFLAGPSGDLSGTVFDATSSDLLADAVVCLDAGAHCVNSLSDGSFAFNMVPAGLHSLKVTRVTYADYNQQINLLAGTKDYIPVALSPANLPPGWVRIVLTWQREGDLDAHYWVSQSGREIYYDDKGDCTKLDLDLACLQNDNKHFGPETVTVKDSLTGTNAFAVVRNVAGVDITEFGAVVNIYDSSGWRETYSAPTWGNGSWWYVFDMYWVPSQSRYTFLPRNLLSYSKPF